MEITIVGSGTVVPEPARVCAGYHLRAASHHLLLDCGPGVLHHLARFGLPWAQLTHVLLSHHHADHIGDIPGLLFSLKHGMREPREAPLTIIGPTGTASLFRRLASAFGDYVTEPGFPVRIRDLVSGETVELGDDVRVRAFATPHTGASLAFRVEAPEGTLGYTGDTGPSAELGDFMRGVDVLLAECSLPEERALDIHLTPAGVADLAVRAQPGRLLLTHVYPLLSRSDLPERARRAGWEGELVVVEDGQRFRVPR